MIIPMILFYTFFHFYIVGMDYVHIKIPKPLAEKIKELKEYRTVSEFVIESTRLRLEWFKEIKKIDWKV